MVFSNEHIKKLNKLYKQLNDLKEGKKVLERAMHNCFYHKDQYNNLFLKLNDLNKKIKEVKQEIIKEKKDYEKSRKSV